MTELLIDGMVSNFGEEMSEAGVTPIEIAEGNTKHLQAVRSLGITVFDRWADGWDRL